MTLKCRDCGKKWEVNYGKPAEERHVFCNKCTADRLCSQKYVRRENQYKKLFVAAVVGVIAGYLLWRAL